jgi:hypothetical protein
MRNSGYSNKAPVSIILPILVFFIIAVSGCILNQSNGIPFNYTVDIYVVDDNGNTIVNQTTIYSRNAIVNDANFSRSSGWARSISINGSEHFSGSYSSIYPGERIVFAASTNNSSLNDDWDNKRFNPGNIGYWTILPYDKIPKNADGYQNGSFNVTIVVSNKTGNMIKNNY